MSNRPFKILLAAGAITGAALAANSMASWHAGQVPAAGPAVDYDRLKSFDPAREGGHLLPNINLWASGHFKDRPVRFVTNSKGFRNDHEFEAAPPPGRLRVLFLGDSFVDGMRTDQTRTIGFQLERRLNESGIPAEVLISGHDNPVNAWYYFQEHGRSFHPHLVVLGVTMGNDLAWHGLGSAFAAGTGPDGERVLRLKKKSVQGAGRFEFLLLPEKAYLPPGFHDRVWETELQWRRWAARKFTFLSQVVPPLLGPYPGERRKVFAAGYYATLGLYYRPLMPEMEVLLREFETVLEGFNACARKNGVPLLVVLFPARIEVSDGDWGKLRRAYSLDGARFDLKGPAERIGRYCRERQIACLDLGPAFRKASRLPFRTLYGPLGDMHFNDEGQSLAARVLAGEVEKIAP